MATTDNFLEQELATVKQTWRDIDGAELVTCVPSSVRFTIKKTQHKRLVVCFQFLADYPQSPIIVELKSKVFSFRLLEGLSKVCEEEAKKYVGQQQVLLMTRFISKFLDDNPLCVCSDEINYIKRELLGDTDELKLKQKTSQVTLKLKEHDYFINFRFTVPHEYPLSELGMEVSDHNFPRLLVIHSLQQARELARKAVQPPLKKNPKDPPFQPKPSLRTVADFLFKQVIRKLPSEKCPCCRKLSLPKDPANVTNEQQNAQFVYRMYCAHLFHYSCLDAYMKKPPFTGGKKCPSCSNRIYHDKWKTSPELAEARWAHKEARARELAEVVDFLE